MDTDHDTLAGAQHAGLTPEQQTQLEQSAAEAGARLMVCDTYGARWASAVIDGTLMVAVDETLDAAASAEALDQALDARRLVRLE